MIICIYLTSFAFFSSVSTSAYTSVSTSAYTSVSTSAYTSVSTSSHSFIRNKCSIIVNNSLVGIAIWHFSIEVTWGVISTDKKVHLATTSEPATNLLGVLPDHCCVMASWIIT